MHVLEENGFLNHIFLWHKVIIENSLILQGSINKAFGVRRFNISGILLISSVI